MHRESCACSKSELDLFAMPPTMMTMQESQWVEFHPISSLTDSAPIEFEIKGQPEDYIDLNSSYLYLKVKVLDKDGNAIDTEAVAPVNNFMHSLFSGVDLYLNNKSVSSSMDTYPYRAYLENLLTYGIDAKNTHLNACVLWEPDEAGEFENTETDTKKEPNNDGFIERREKIKEGQSLELMDRLHLDMWLQEKYLLNGVDVRLRLNRSSTAFHLMSADKLEHKTKIEEAKLFVRRVEVLPKVGNDISHTLSRTTAKYPIRRVEVKTFTIPRGQHSMIEDHLFQGQLPKRLILGMVSNEAFNGAYDKDGKDQNPFNFQHFDVKKIEVSRDGKTLCTRPFEPNFAKKTYLRSYLSLYEATGQLGTNTSHGITYDDYAGGYALWAFDFTPDQGSDEGHFHPIKSGQIRVELQFAKALEKTVNVLLYAEFDNTIEINSLREVITDY